MKFKSQAKQNQLIENISPHHLVVGIDIAQLEHVARAVNYRGIIIGDSLSFSNDEDRFTRLLQWIHMLKTLLILPRSRIPYAKSLLAIKGSPQIDGQGQ